jgi:ubiquinol-cytochrome c reductase cytochrome c1 subunit
MKNLLTLVLKASVIALGVMVIGTVLFVGGHSAGDIKQVKWPFDGVLGKVDEPSAQRGLQVYKEVCASCHGLKQVAYRNLSEIGFTEDEIKSIASEYDVENGLPNDDGEMYMRKAKASDKFVSPFANEQEARSANGGAYPPDLSLITKARMDGPNYLYSLLQGYDEVVPDCIGAAPHHNIYKRAYYSLFGSHETEACNKLAEGMSYNKYFGATQQIAMPAPLYEDGVEYNDGTEATIEQQARDVTVFLQWAAEPEMETRKEMGVGVMFFLSVFTLFFWYAKKRVWARLK